MTTIDWKALLKTEQHNINFSLETYLSKVNSLLHTHASLKKNSKYKLKFKTKPWITPGLQKSVAIKTKLLKKFIHLKEPHKKLHSHNEYKKLQEYVIHPFEKKQT